MTTEPDIKNRLVFLPRCVIYAGSTRDDKIVEGDRGREPGRTVGGRGTGDGRTKGGRRDLYDGGKRERNSKRQAFVICYCLLPVKETNPTTFLDFHLTFSEA